MPKRKPKASAKKKKKQTRATRGGSDRKRSFKKRMKKSKQRRQSKSFFRSDAEIPFWKCDEGQHTIDIIPYMAGENDPDCEQGEDTYVLEVFTHRDVGNVEGQQVICLAETYNEPCPICEHRKKLQREGDADDDLIDELTPSRYPRSIYNIVCYDSRREEDKGVQVWHTSHYLFEKHLLKLAEGPTRRGSSKPDSFVEFACPVEGKSIGFETEGKGINTKHLALQFLERDYEIDDDTLEEAYTLDDLIEKPTYDEVYAMHWGEDPDVDDDEDEEDEDDRPSSRRRGSKPKRKASRRRREPDDDDDDDDDDDVEDDDYEDVEDDDVVEEDECPAGGVFGEDCNQYEDCEDCDMWDDCYAQSNGDDDEDEEDEEPRRKPKRKKKTKPAKRKQAKPKKQRKLRRR